MDNEEDKPIDIAVDTLLSLSALTERLDLSRRQLELYRGTGAFPEPSVYIGRSPRWTVRCINEWLAKNKKLN